MNVLIRTPEDRFEVGAIRRPSDADTEGHVDLDSVTISPITAQKEIDDGPHASPQLGRCAATPWGCGEGRDADRACASASRRTLIVSTRARRRTRRSGRPGGP